MKIPFNRPYIFDDFIENIKIAYEHGIMAGDGHFTKLCNKWFEDNYGVEKALLVHSGTAALEMAAMLADIEPGDEVIMPSYTFVSTANAFVLRGAIPVFVDIRKDNCNIDETLIEEAITPNTKAIVPVHYAGVACEMDTIMMLARKYNLVVVEDAAQAFNATYKGKLLGTIGDFGCLSFHETKNIVSGEGGMVFVNSPKYVDRAEIIREKGTNRSRFFRGQVDKYTWVDMGSSYLPAEIVAAYLYSGLKSVDRIEKRRLAIWHQYYNMLKKHANKGLIKMPFINDFASNNAHMFYILFDNFSLRSQFIDFMKKNNIYTPFHYIPLHNSPAGKKFGKYVGDMKNTLQISDTLVRLPLFFNLSDEKVKAVVKHIDDFFDKRNRKELSL